MKNRAVIYARYSSAKQNDESIEQQVEKARKYASERGYKVIREYCDRAVSGRSDERAEFQRMLKDSKKHEFDIVIAWKIDRLGRNRYQLEINKFDLKKNGVRIEYVAENIPEGNEGILLEAVLEGMAEYYSSQLSSNVKRGMLYNARQGKVVGPAPLGYRTDSDKRLVIDEATAPVVRKVFHDYAKGRRAVDIIEELNCAGYKTQTGRPFGRSSLHRLLSNEKYIGIYKYKVGTPDEVTLDDCIPPIVDKETFRKCQKAVKNQARGKRTEVSKDMYILSGKLFCGHCGESMQGMSGTGRHGHIQYYYRCYGKAKHKCKKKNVRAQYIEDVVICSILDLLNNEELIEAIADKLMEIYNAECESELASVPAMEKELAQIPKKIDKLFKVLLEQDGIDKKITAQIAELTAREEYLTDEIKNAKLNGIKVLNKEFILHYFHNLTKNGIKTDADKKMLVDSFVKRIYLYDDKLIIDFNYSDGADAEPMPLPDDIGNEESIVTCDNRVTITVFYKPLRVLLVVDL